VSEGAAASSQAAVPAAPARAPARAATIHLVVGWATVAVFLMTGVFMRVGYPGVAPPDLAHRVFFRTHHLYLLAAALVHLLVGGQRTAGGPVPRPRLGIASSTLLLAAPPLLLLGFATEHLTPALRGEATSLGWYTLAAGVLLHLFAWRWGTAAPAE